MTELLRNHIDKRVKLNGAFEKLCDAPHKPYKVALLQDATVTTADGKIVDIGHTWLQDADSLEGFDLEEGDRIHCSVRVCTYDKEGQLKYGFKYPTDVQRVSRPVALRIPQWQEKDLPEKKPAAFPPQEPEQPPALGIVEPLSPVAAIRAAKALATKLGGMDRLRELIEEL